MNNKRKKKKRNFPKTDISIKTLHNKFIIVKDIRNY
jgi:hypothetical protein